MNNILPIFLQLITTVLWILISLRFSKTRALRTTLRQRWFSNSHQCCFSWQSPPPFGLPKLPLTWSRISSNTSAILSSMSRMPLSLRHCIRCIRTSESIWRRARCNLFTHRYIWIRSAGWLAVYGGHYRRVLLLLLVGADRLRTRPHPTTCPTENAIEGSDGRRWMFVRSFGELREETHEDDQLQKGKETRNSAWSPLGRREREQEIIKKNCEWPFNAM